jgi:hypothetical protein
LAIVDFAADVVVLTEGDSCGRAERGEREESGQPDATPKEKERRRAGTGLDAPVEDPNWAKCVQSRETGVFYELMGEGALAPWRVLFCAEADYVHELLHKDEGTVDQYRCLVIRTPLTSMLFRLSVQNGVSPSLHILIGLTS